MPEKTWTQRALETVRNTVTGGTNGPSILARLSGIPDAPRNAREKQAALKALQQRGQQLRQTYYQPVAGLVSTTVANSARPKETGATIGGYRPALADSLPAFAGTVKTLAGYPNEKGSFLDNSMQRAMLADDRTNDALGIKPPQNAMETALNLAGSLVVPGPKIKAATGIGKLAKATAEVALPLRQGSMKSAAATVLPIGVGLREGIDAIAPDASYHGIADQLGSNDTTHQGTAPQTQLSEEDAFAAEIAEGLGPDPELSLELEVEQGFSETHEAEKQSAWVTAGEVLGAAALGTASYKIGKTLLAKAPLVPLDTATVIGQAKKESRGNKTLTKVFDSNRPIRTNANDFLTPNFARQYNYKLDTISNQATGSQVRHFMTTGWAPQASKRYTPVARVLEPMAQELSPQQQTMLGDALLFATSLDDIKRTGVQSSFNDVNPAEMQNLVNFVNNDATLSKHFKNVQQSFADLLHYETDIGKRSASDLAKFRQANPNYVHMSRDVSKDVDPLRDAVTPARYDADASTVDDLARNVTEERAGVQKGAVRNPVDELADRWRDAIRWGKMNDLRYQGLEEFAGSGAKALDGKPLVYKLPAGEKPKGEAANVHTVLESGQPVYYQVNDPALDQAFRFRSRFGIKPMEAWRQVYQSMTTGTLGSLTSGFQFAVSPIYDTMVGTLLRPEGTHLGLINEALSKYNGSIGAFDATAHLGAYTGALRYMYDDLTRGMADNLSDQLMRDNSLLRQTIGDGAVTALRDKIQQAYQSSTKALGEELGIFSHTMRGSPDSLDVVGGMEDIAPQFTLDQGKRIALQAAQQPEWYKGVLSSSKVPWVAARTSAIGRALQLTTEAMHNGFRYSALAANKSRLTDIDKLASDMRRISVDSSGHGSSDLVNAIAGSTTYSNLTLQTFYEVGRRAKDNPVNFGSNFLQVMGGLVALKYASLASDSETQERHAAKSPEQATRTLSLWGGAELPIEPLLRAPFAAMSAYMDHVSGQADGMFNPYFLESLDTWFDDDDDDEAQERLSKTVRSSLWEAALNNMPVSPDQVPMIGTALAAYGIDPGMSKGLGTGQASEVRTQTVSGFDADKKFTGGLMSAYHENIITSALGSFAEDVLRTADEVYRSAGHYKGPLDAMRTVSDKWTDRMAGSTKLFKPMLFGQYETVKSVADTNFGLLKDRQSGIDAVMSIYRKDVMAEALQGSNLDPRYSDILENGAYQLDPKYLGTPLQTIGMFTQQLQTMTRPIASQLAALNNEKQRAEGNTQMRLEDRNKEVNRINEERKALTYQQLMLARQTEDSIASAIGQDFSYDGFQPDAYLQQTQPVQAAPQSP